MHALFLIPIFGAILAAIAVLGLVAPFKFVEPLNDITGAVPGITTITIPPMKRINIVGIQATATKAAGGVGVTSIPVPSDAISLIQCVVGSKPQRTRTATELFGVTGLNARIDLNHGGMVVYTQVGNANLSTLPVLIGSAADVAQQALLTTNTATTATFYLPIIFSEQYRKTYEATEAGGLVTGYDNGRAVGTVTFEVTNATVANISAVAFTAWYEYDEVVAKAGSAIWLIKEYRHGVTYAAAGDIECATQLQALRPGDGICRISLRTTSDVISRVVVKQGARVLRDITRGRMHCSLATRDYEVGAQAANRFDLEFDLNDNQATAPFNNPNAPLSIVATLDTAADVVKQITVLSSFWGPLD